MIKWPADRHEWLVFTYQCRTGERQVKVTYSVTSITEILGT